MKYRTGKMKEYRRRKNISREDMAFVLGISVYTYRAYENGNRPITAETLKKISIILECKTDDLI